MRRMRRAAWLTLGVVVLVACGEEAPARTTDTSRALLSQPRAEDVATEIDTTRLMVTAGQDLPIELLGVNLGSVEAPVKIIEFIDFGCGYCRQFQLETFPILRGEFIETGMVEWKFLPFVSGMFGNSPAVTEAAECALDQNSRLFDALADRLWNRQSEWKSSSEPEALALAWLIELGGDEEAYGSCLDDDRRLDRVLSATALAAELGIRATPTFWIVGGGPIQGALPLATFRQILSTVHGQLTQADDPDAA